MEIRILGPMEVMDGSRRLTVPAGRARALLALLALRAGEPLAADRLIDELWGEEPPPTASTALQGLVLKLRRTLGRSAIETSGGGYRLAVAPEAVDAVRFKTMIERARVADTDDRARILREALALWRGPALADFAYEPFAQSAIAALDESRLSVVEDRIDADLSLGRTSLAAEIADLVEQYPLRERLRALLMLALYREGRQSEALDAYLAARATMNEEIGVELGPALQELQKAILRQDVSLSFTPATAAAGPWLPRERGMALSLALAEVYLVLGRFTDAQRMLRDVADAGDEATAQAARLELARIQFIVGPDPVPLEEIEREAQNAVAFFGNDDAVVERAVFLIGCVQMREGKMVDSESAFRDSLARADRVGHMRERMATRWMTGEIVVNGPTAVPKALQQIDELGTMGDMEHPGLLMQRGALTAMTGRVDEARFFIGRAREICVDVLGAPRLLIFVYAAEAALASLAGDLDAAEGAMRRRLEIAQQGEERESIAQAAGWLALLLKRLGRSDEADEFARLSVTRAPFGVPGRAIALAASGDARGAVEIVPEELPNLRADLLLEAARELRAARDEAAARTAEDEAARLYRLKGNILSAERLVPTVLAPV